MPSQYLERLESTHDGIILPHDTRVYAIGDIHGRIDLLDILLDKITADMAKKPHALCEIVFLGDYVDRGPHSHAVIDRLSWGPILDAKCTFLCGNHEQFLLDILDGGDSVSRWIANGGDMTFSSYGINVDEYPETDWEQATAADFRTKVPPSHAAFLHALKPAHQVGSVYFAHAGVNPDRPLDAQRRKDLIWIRGKFLHSTKDMGVVVIHGHTPVPEPEVSRLRINIDTGAWSSGCLTAVVLETGKVRFLAT